MVRDKRPDGIDPTGGLEYQKQKDVFLEIV